MADPLVLTVEEAAELLRVSRSAAYAAIQRGELPAVHIGRTIRVPRGRLLALIREETSAAPLLSDEPEGGAG
jgi:excisionase family DNA binding protein